MPGRHSFYQTVFLALFVIDGFFTVWGQLYKMMVQYALPVFFARNLKLHKAELLAQSTFRTLLPHCYLGERLY